jgi:pyruvate dehydrogenase E2 component (dihydrolipoamide acetyltransferase)
MSTDVLMPALGLAQETGKVIRWLKAEGDLVARGEPLLEVETDKVTVEIEAPADGTLAAVSAREGEEVPVGQPVALILAAGEAAPEIAEPASEAAVAAPERSAPRLVAVDVPPARRGLASPKARRMAAELALDLDAIEGSGPYGAVVAADLAAAPSPASVSPPLDEVGSVWRRMAENTTRSWQSVPHFFLLREVDAGRLEGWRESTRRRSGYEGVTHTDLLVKLCAAALREHPRVNASWRDGGLIAQPDVNVGIAVATDEGLVVPVVHAADRLELREIAERRRELVDAARQNRLRPDDVSGGTFTISNLGMFGVDAFLAIVNAPQAAILAVGRIVDRVVPVAGRPEVRPTMALSLSFDHRVVDGARGAQFLDTLASLVEEPAGLVS